MAPNLSFAPSIANGTCNPAASAQYITQFFNNTDIAPIPGLATITADLYGDATVPSAATEAGASGLSPQILIPTPVVPSPSACVASASMPMADAPIPMTAATDPMQAMASGSAVAMSSGVSPPSGC